mmetsp:Transcript_16882/g.24431  ORF Transcript_16882/g.24431 Transcript_16882/m.24431 type:complete len:576 (+) Transcript_16882:92-1819(+)|eukprot:CAMPEP_0202447926 /NCGR_PEP_ID=MMETSP1360-20130828/6704_1 /ASSEMBLY_ACC=CAM_ASM_000848 /TAXON_ID=515479 /ORGANISM="Licmophora paradoxa, Strain CCMP2313" /LENGTH=575 /DNA_ID=CAMNT_0049065237 /DNA_START=80 /DNA_END=1807 /DNA_ORIENTATION=+
MSDDEARYGAILEFLGYFPTLSSAPPTNIGELSDGVALFEALSEIAPDYFDPTTIARHLGDNWALKTSNVRKLLRNLQNYFHDGLSKDADFDSITSRVSSIARSGDPEAIANVFELVAAAAVSCEGRGEFVGRIMQMTPENQGYMKDVIEAGMSRLTDYDDAEDDEDEEAEENELVFGQATPMATRSNDSVLFAAPGEDRENLEKALTDIKRELAATKNHSHMMVEEQESAHKKLRALVEDLQDRLVRREEELTMVESQLKTASIDLDDARTKVEDLEDKNTQLADDLDLANGKAEQLRKAEATIVAYRKKLDDVGSMTQQMTDLEDQAASYLKQIVELENNVKKVPSLQRTIDQLKEQVSLMEQEHENAGSVVKGSVSEIAELKSKLNAAESAKKMYEEELNELRAQQAQTDDLGSPVAGLSLSGQPSAETKEKMMRMEIENMALKEEIEKLKVESSGAAASAAAASSGNSEMQTEISKLKEDLEKKEAEKKKIGSDKDKLEAYTKRTLAKFQEKYLVALQECKAKLKEKQDKIEALESRSASEKTAQKREERLLSSTIYELGLTIMQNRLKER